MTLCVKAFDAADQQIKPGGNECMLTLWGSNWQPGAPLTFNEKHALDISRRATTRSYSLGKLLNPQAYHESFRRF